MNRLLEQLKELKLSVRFDPSRKLEIRRILQQLSSQPQKRMSFQFLRVAFAVLVLVIVAGTSASYAAADALPGDALYPFKVHVNEAVQSALTFAPQAKAQLEIDRAELRLEEADQLVLLNRLTGSAKQAVEDNFDRHAQNIDDRVQKLESSGDGSGALDLNSRFESVLQVHQQVLESLHGQTGPDPSQLGPLQDNVTQTLNSVRRHRAKIESGDGKNTPEKSSQSDLVSAQNAVNEVKTFLAQPQRSRRRGKARNSQDDVTKLELMLSQAKDKNQSGDYKDASSLSNQAIRDARELKTLIKVQRKIDVDVKLGIGD